MAWFARRYAKINSLDANGRSPIRIAVQAGHASVVSYLIQMKALLDPFDDEDVMSRGGFFFNQVNDAALDCAPQEGDLPSPPPWVK